MERTSGLQSGVLRRTTRPGLVRARRDRRPLQICASMEILRRASHYFARTAVRVEKQSYSYGQLLHAARQVAVAVPERQGEHGARIGVLTQPSGEYVASMLGTWWGGGICVPLAPSHPERELQYIIQDAGVSVVLASEGLLAKAEAAARPSGTRVLSTAEAICWPVAEEVEVEEAGLPQPGDEGALIIYTSGTTGQPKGVLHTHRTLQAQISCLVEAWQWRQDDVILHPLPLHHIHGIVNAMLCALHSGARIDFQTPRFAAAAAWDAFREGEVSVFMGVPTMYTQLLSSYEAMPQEQQRSAAAAAAGLRLAISGSAACPVPVMDAWRSISGQTLLERFGMTEVGMALSNPYQGERRPGFVGLPLPGVEARIDTSSVPSAEDAEWRPDGTAADAGEAGELLIRGPNVFKEYWGRPEATAESFTDDGFFRTGDTVTMGGEPPYYKIVGRTSVDIIKSGGYKIGALHIENCVLENAGVAECAAVGVADDTYGQVVGLVLAFKPPAAAGTLADDIEHMLTVRSDDESCESRNLGVEKRVLDYMKKFLRQRLPPYQLPRMVRVVDSIPRNAMGKVNKKQLVKVFDE